MEFEEYLKTCLEPLPASRVRDAMAYALLDGGKRVRPNLLLAALEDYGLDPEAGLPAAAALEMIHTYSLIHDDLPCMDDDDLRRGRASTHKAFDEAIAVLAGDGLQPLAFEQLAGYEDAAIVRDLVQILATKAGSAGMVYGQALDLSLEHAAAASLEQLRQVDLYKTGCLLEAPLEMAAVLAGKKEDLPLMKQLGQALGLQFQIQDDILDVTSSEEAMGKSLSDTRNEKSTFVSLLGLEQAEQLVQELEDSIQNSLRQLGMEEGKLADLCQKMARRSF